MNMLLGLIFGYLRDCFRSQEQQRAENILLRHQLNVLGIRAMPFLGGLHNQYVRMG
jgi:hypothetical protein